MAKKKIDKRTKEYKEYIKNHPQGAGDIIENITEKTGIKKLVEFLAGDDCGCDERREKLNAMMPVRYKAKRCFTENEFVWYDDYYKNRTLNLVTESQLKEIVKLHEGVFLWKVNNLCHNCSGSATIIRDMIKRLDKVYSSYNVSVITTKTCGRCHGKDLKDYGNFYTCNECLNIENHKKIN